MTYHPTAVAIAIVITTMLATSLIQWTFLIRLRCSHRSQWLHAGSPTIWSDQSFLSAWPTIRYLQNKAYLSSGDPGGARFCGRFRAPMVIGYWLTMAVFVGGIIVSVQNGWPSSWQ